MERGFKSRCENLSLQLRRELGLLPHAPLLPRELADHVGVFLWEPQEISGLSVNSLKQLKTDKDSWSAVTVSLDGTNAIIYNPYHSTARQSSDVMHELSHILLKHKPAEILLYSRDTDQDFQIVLREYNPDLEKEADWLAGCLLLPRDALYTVKRQGIDDSEICDIYKVSQDLLTFRTNMTGINRQFK